MPPTSNDPIASTKHSLAGAPGESQAAQSVLPQRVASWAVLLLGVLLATVIGLEAAITKSTHFPAEHWFAFQAWLGIAATVAIAAAGWCLKWIAAKREDYYDA